MTFEQSEYCGARSELLKSLSDVAADCRLRSDALRRKRHRQRLKGDELGPEQGLVTEAARLSEEAFKQLAYVSLPLQSLSTVKDSLRQAFVALNQLSEEWSDATHFLDKVIDSASRYDKAHAACI